MQVAGTGCLPCEKLVKHFGLSGLGRYERLECARFGRLDLYADGVYRGTAIADRDAKAGATKEHVYYKQQPAALREITFYLPLYMGVKVQGIGLDPDARIERAKPFALAKPVVFYGTSITQGGCASRSGMSYQAILGRTLNVDFVNLGFSGNGLGEPELARAVAGIDAACFVMDFAQNNPTVESLTSASSRRRSAFSKRSARNTRRRRFWLLRRSTPPGKPGRAIHGSRVCGN